MEKQLLVTVSEMAKMLGIPVSSAYKLLDNNEIKFLCLGVKTLRVPVEAIEEYIQKRTIPAKS